MGRRIAGRMKHRLGTVAVGFELARSNTDINALIKEIELERDNHTPLFTSGELDCMEQTLDWLTGRSDARPIP